MKLADTMTELVEEAWDILKKEPDLTHQTVCDKLADSFDLWRPREGSRGLFFPRWLSRVVEGIMRDVANEEEEI